MGSLITLLLRATVLRYAKRVSGIAARFSTNFATPQLVKELSRFSLPAVPAVLLAIVSMEGGAAVAKGLFPMLGAAGRASLRIGISSLLLLAMVRPPLRRLQPVQADGGALRPGAGLDGFYFMFYSAIANPPLAEHYVQLKED